MESRTFVYQEEQWCRPADAAKYFKVTTMTLYRWRKEACFPKYLKRDRVILYDIKAIERWLSSRST